MKQLPSVLLLQALLLPSCYAAAATNDDLMTRLEALEKRLDEQQQALSSAAQPLPLSWEGYAVVNLYGIDTYSNAQDNEPEFQWRADVERFVLEPSYRFNDAIRFVAEIEFEHGGTGSAVEYEAEEFGEYEGEIEQGGEVLLEELFIEISQSRALNWRFGHMAVHVGMVNTHNAPSDYFSTRRSAAETRVCHGPKHGSGGTRGLAAG